MTSKLIYHNRRLNYLPTFLLLFTGLFFIYLLTSAGNTPYDYFTRLAQSFLEGKYWISDNPPWLNELIPAGNGNYYVVYPAMPAILSIPFVGMFGKSFPQQILAHLLGAGTSVLLAKLSFCYKKDIKIALWIGLLSGLGSIIWFLSSTGSSWYLGQLTASFFLTAALLE